MYVNHVSSLWKASLAFAKTRSSNWRLMQYLEILAILVVALYDVVFAGGSASKIVAALSAHRGGASTLFVERADLMGGWHG